MAAWPVASAAAVLTTLGFSVAIALPTWQGPMRPVRNPAADSGLSMLSAIHDQLGLKLEAARAKADFPVIDHVERPTAD